MCGITGYIGQKEAYPIVINGLKRLEYRGYDSSGVMLYDGKEIHVSKTKGKVSDLEDITNRGRPVAEFNHWNWSHPLGYSWSAK